jgi:hypothetical protein
MRLMMGGFGEGMGLWMSILGATMRSVWGANAATASLAPAESAAGRCAKTCADNRTAATRVELRRRAEDERIPMNGGIVSPFPWEISAGVPGGLSTCVLSHSSGSAV